jgi:hypothetical protein
MVFLRRYVKLFNTFSEQVIPMVFKGTGLGLYILHVTEKNTGTIALNELEEGTK